MRQHRGTVVIAALMLLRLSSASAQTRQAPEPTTVEDFSTLAAPGTKVSVVDDAGHETRGRVLRFGPEALTIEVRRREVTIDRPNIAQIYQRGDSLKNGALRGLVTGGLLGVFAGVTVQNCGLFAYVRCTAGDKASLAALFGGVLGAFGTGIGVGVDALVTGRRLLYESSPPAPAAFEITPSFGRAGASVALALTW
jgi:hypothetical protein